MLFKIVRKSFKKARGLILALSILLIISAMFLGVRYFTYDTLEANYEHMRADGNVEDFRLNSTPTFEETLVSEGRNVEAEVEADYDVNLEQIRQISTSFDEGPNYKITKYLADNMINLPKLVDGSLPSNENEVALLPGHAEAANLKVGDVLTIGEVDYKVSGIAYFQEWVFPINFLTGQFTTDFSRFAPVYLNETSFDKLWNENVGTYTNELAYVGQFNDQDFVDDSSITERYDIYNKIIDDYVIEYPVLDSNGAPTTNEQGQLLKETASTFTFAMDYTGNISIVGVEQEITGSRTSTVYLSFIVTLIAIMIAIVLVNSVFKSQKREIGILKAEGISANSLGASYVIYMAILFVIVFLLGTIGSYFVSQGLLSTYAKQFQIYDYPIENIIWLHVIGLMAAVALVSLVIIYLLSIRRNLRQKILLLIKNVDNDHQPKHHLKFLSKLKFKRRYQINIALRNIAKTIMLIFAVFISSLMLFMGILMLSSLNDIVDGTYTNMFTYDYSVRYSDALPEYNNNSGLELTIPLINAPNNEDITEKTTISLTAYDFANNDYFHLKNLDEKAFKTNKPGVVATTGFMQKYDAKVGDVITIGDSYVEDKEYEVEIIDETDDFFIPYLYADISYYQDLIGVDDKFANTTYYEGELTNEVESDILAYDEYAYIFEQFDLQAELEQSMAIFYVIIGIIAVFAGVISFISLYAITSVIIASNRKTISVMKVLGYNDQEISTMTIGVYKWVVILIYFISIPLIEAIIRLIIKIAFADAGFTLSISINYFYAIFGFVVIFAVYLISKILTMRSIRNISLAESLKVDE